MVRAERAGDAPAIHALTAAAFAGQPFSEGTEPFIVDRLRADGDLTLSLVAEDDDDAIIGHIAFSPVRIGGASDWFGLGPISVTPPRQRSGIGSALMKAGLDEMRRRGARGIVLIGDPAYYGRFGFEGGVGLTYKAVPTAYVQALSLSGDAPRGEIAYAPGFDARPPQE